MINTIFTTHDAYTATCLLNQVDLCWYSNVVEVKVSLMHLQNGNIIVCCSTHCYYFHSVISSWILGFGLSCGHICWACGQIHLCSIFIFFSILIKHFILMGCTVSKICPSHLHLVLGNPGNEIKKCLLIHVQNNSYLDDLKNICCFFLNHNIISNTMIKALSMSSKPATVPPITMDELLFVGCFELTWHSPSSNEEMVTTQLLSTLISMLWTGIVMPFLIHCSIYEASSELEALAPPWKIARKVTAWGEAGKQRNTLFVIFSWDKPHWQSWLILEIIAVEISLTLLLVFTFYTFFFGESYSLEIYINSM